MGEIAVVVAAAEELLQWDWPEGQSASDDIAGTTVTSPVVVAAAAVVVVNDTTVAAAAADVVAVVELAICLCSRKLNPKHCQHFPQNCYQRRNLILLVSLACH